MALSKKYKIAFIVIGSIGFALISYLIFKLVKSKKNTISVQGSFKGRNCDELHAFQSTGGRIIGGMNDKVNAKLEELYSKGINPEVKEVIVDMDADSMSVNWQVIISESKDGNAWVGFTSRGSSGSTAYDRANGEHVGQDFDSVLRKVRSYTNEPNADMKLVLDHLYNLNRQKESLGKCPTRQLFYTYTKPIKFPKH